MASGGGVGMKGPTAAVASAPAKSRVPTAAEMQAEATLQALSIRKAGRLHCDQDACALRHRVAPVHSN